MRKLSKQRNWTIASGIHISGLAASLVATATKKDLVSNREWNLKVAINFPAKGKHRNR
jgi:hypothetical protein